jgi:hypothetical protein
LFRILPELCNTALAGDPQGGGSPRVGGAGRIDACQRFLLATQRAPAWGEPTPPRLALGGNGKGGSNSLLPQAISVSPQLVQYKVSIIDRQPPRAALPFALLLSALALGAV